MCGIAAYIGNGNAFDFISQALVKMEYRGYDSYGMKIGTEEHKALGAPSNSMPDHMDGTIGIGHTRWATHGKVSLKNCHPVTYMGCHVVHNGTVENTEHHRIRQRGGYTTDTDTEIIACELYRDIKLTVIIKKEDIIIEDFTNKSFRNINLYLDRKGIPLDTIIYEYSELINKDYIKIYVII